MKRAIFIAAMVFTGNVYAQLSIEQATTSPRAVVEAGLPASHPSVFYAYAQRLFGEGSKQESVVWFYVGQLRYRYLLATQPDLRPDGEPAVMASLNETVGQTINDWAGGDPAAWAEAIGDALDWDAANGNAVTPKNRAAAEQAGVREGLVGLQQMVRASAEEIREQRRANGLEVR